MKILGITIGLFLHFRLSTQLFSYTQRICEAFTGVCNVQSVQLLMALLRLSKFQMH